jgi:hypothetical protein
MLRTAKQKPCCCTRQPEADEIDSEKVKRPFVKPHSLMHAVMQDDGKAVLCCRRSIIRNARAIKGRCPPLPSITRFIHIHPIIPLIFPLSPLDTT